MLRLSFGSSTMSSPSSVSTTLSDSSHTWDAFSPLEEPSLPGCYAKRQGTGLAVYVRDLLESLAVGFHHINYDMIDALDSLDKRSLDSLAEVLKFLETTEDSSSVKIDSKSWESLNRAFHREATTHYYFANDDDPFASDFNREFVTDIISRLLEAIARNPHMTKLKLDDLVFDSTATVATLVKTTKAICFLDLSSSNFAYSLTTRQNLQELHNAFANNETLETIKLSWTMAGPASGSCILETILLSLGNHHSLRKLYIENTSSNARATMHHMNALASLLQSSNTLEVLKLLVYIGSQEVMQSLVSGLRGNNGILKRLSLEGRLSNRAEESLRAYLRSTSLEGNCIRSLSLPRRYGFEDDTIGAAELPYPPPARASSQPPAPKVVSHLDVLELKGWADQFGIFRAVFNPLMNHSRMIHLRRLHLGHHKDWLTRPFFRQFLPLVTRLRELKTEWSLTYEQAMDLVRILKTNGSLHGVDFYLESNVSRRLARRVRRKVKAYCIRNKKLPKLLAVDKSTGATAVDGAFVPSLFGAGLPAWATAPSSMVTRLMASGDGISGLSPKDS